MTKKKHVKLLLDYSLLLGEFAGTLQGITHWDIPKELKVKLEKQIQELKATQVDDSILDELHNEPYEYKETDMLRLHTWLMTEDREPAKTKFTSGNLRNVAYELELMMKECARTQDKREEMAACMLSILDSLKLHDNGSLELGDETLNEMMFRKMKAYKIDLNKELGFTHLKPVSKLMIEKEKKADCTCKSKTKDKGLYCPVHRNRKA